MLVHVGDAVFPYLIVPSFCRKRIPKNASIAIQRCQLAGLLLNGHLREQVLDSVIDFGRWILVNIHHSILVEIYPTVMIDSAISIGLCCSHTSEQAEKKNTQYFHKNNIYDKVIYSPEQDQQCAHQYFAVCQYAFNGFSP